MKIYNIKFTTFAFCQSLIITFYLNNAQHDIFCYCIFWFHPIRLNASLLLFILFLFSQVLIFIETNATIGRCFEMNLWLENNNVWKNIIFSYFFEKRSRTAKYIELNADISEMTIDFFFSKYECGIQYRLNAVI